MTPEVIEALKELDATLKEFNHAMKDLKVEVDKTMKLI